MPQARGEGGAAVVDFVLVSILVLALFLIVFQVGVAFHVRTLVAAAASEGARFGAAADRTPQEGAERAQSALRDSLGDRIGAAIRCTPATGDGTVNVGGAVVVEIVCRGPMPIVFLPSPAVTIEVKGHALEESR
jgi:Flp pilus assembly protein TadG